MAYIYTKELLEEAVQASDSFAGVLRYLGRPQAGGTQFHITNKIKEYGIDFSHFTGKKYMKGKISPQRKTPEDILKVLPEGSNRAKVAHLRRALLEVGRPHQCAGCGLRQFWNSRPLVLEINHIDGNWLNNLEDNLEFLCPNCHSQDVDNNRSWKTRRRESKAV